MGYDGPGVVGTVYFCESSNYLNWKMPMMKETVSMVVGVDVAMSAVVYGR